MLKIFVDGNGVSSMPQGLTIAQDDGTALKFRADFSGFLADDKAHKEILASMGAAGITHIQRTLWCDGHP